VGRVLGILGTVIKDLRRVALGWVALGLGRGGEGVGGLRSDQGARGRETGTETTIWSTVVATKAPKRTTTIGVAVETNRGGERRSVRATRRRRKRLLRGKLLLLLLGVGRRFVGLLHLHTEQLETLLDVVVVGIEVSSLGVGVERVTQLIARLVQCAQIVPHLAQVWVETDRPAVRVQCVTVLVDLVVEDTDGTPEGGVATIAVNSLLVSVVSLSVLLL